MPLLLQQANLLAASEQPAHTGQQALNPRPDRSPLRAVLRALLSALLAALLGASAALPPRGPG